LALLGPVAFAWPRSSGMDVVSTQIGERVKTERERHGLSQRALAERADVSSARISNIEAGAETNPGLEVLTKIAGALGLGVADLFLSGPDQVDAAFALRPGVDLGPLATLERRLLDAVGAAVPDLTGRVAVWPWCEPPSDRGAAVSTRSSAIWLRAPASAVASVALLGGASLSLGHGSRGVRLPAPVVRPVQATETLRVLVRAACPSTASDAVRREATAAGCCPPVTILGKRPLGSGWGWLATLGHVPASASQVLQRLRVSGPDGLFVPV
jgi:transcriptional regulator with XRE-family HTH domain